MYTCIHACAGRIHACVCRREYIYSFHPACLPFVSSEISADEVNKPMHTCVNMRYESWPACVGITMHKLMSAAAILELS